MHRFIIYRLAQSVVTVFVVSVLVFLFMHLAGDPVILLLPPEAKAEDIESFRHLFGLDRPLYVQYLEFMGKFWYSDTVKSFKFHDPLLPLVLSHLRWTLVLAMGTLMLSLLIAIPLGTITALYRGRFFDVVIRMIAVFGQSIPPFWTAMILMLLFAVKWDLLPVAGLGVKQAILPIVTLASFQIAVLLRLFRSEMLEVLNQDYIRTARSKGLQEVFVVTRHAFKNAAIPVLAMAGLLLNFLVLGAVVVEPIFAWPGLGWLVVQSVFARDFPVVVAAAIIAAVVVALINLATDILHVWFDPRVRLN